LATGGQAPLLIGLELESALRQAAAAGWQVSEIVRTAPPWGAPAGPQRVIKQMVIGPRLLALVVAASVELTHLCSRGAPH